MSEELKTHTKLVLEYNRATDWGGTCPRSFAEELLQQIQARDILIHQYRLLCDTPIYHTVRYDGEDFLESWKYLRNTLRESARQVEE